MAFEYLAEIIYKDTAITKNVLENFNKTAGKTENRGFGIVINKKGQCIGVISDGDIRRKLVKGMDINTEIKHIMNTNFKFVNQNDSYHHILRQFDKDVSNLPVIDNKGIPIDLYQYSRFAVSARSEPKIIRARVPVRVSFSGGGTDMSSYINKTSAAVLSSTINKYCTASIIVRDDDEVHIKSKDLSLSYKAKNIKEIKYG